MSVIINGTTGITTPSDTTPIVNSSTTLSLQTGGTTAVTVDASQNVGIGTVSPAYKLHSATNIGTGSTGNNGFLGFKRASDGVEIGSMNTDGTNLVVNTGTALAFQTSGTERMRITSGGSLLINSTTNNGEILRVNGGGTAATSGNMNTGAIFSQGDGSAAINIVAGGSGTNTINSAYANNAGVGIPLSILIGGTQALGINTSRAVTKPYQPAFFAAGSAGSISLSPGSNVPYSTLSSTFCSSNRSGGYNTSTYIYTAPVAGLYYFYAQLYVSTQESMQWYKNGSALGFTADAALWSYGSGGAGTWIANGSIILELAAGDYVSSQVRGGNAAVSVYMNHSCFFGYLIG